MIELYAVTKRFGRRGEVVALDAVSLVIEAGELVLVTGPSGAGKTTLVRLLAGLELPDDGVARVFGHDLRRLRRSSLPGLRRRMGVALQEFLLVPERSARANVGLALEVRGVARRELAQRTGEALGSVGLERRADELVAALSFGERQRVAIARALVVDPELLLLDEPTGNLDRAAARSLVGLLQLRHRAGRTAVVTTNDADVIATAAGGPWRHVRLQAGALREVSSPAREARAEAEAWPGAALASMSSIFSLSPLTPAPGTTVTASAGGGLDK